MKDFDYITTGIENGSFKVNESFNGSHGVYFTFQKNNTFIVDQVNRICSTVCPYNRFSEKR